MGDNSNMSDISSIGSLSDGVDGAFQDIMNTTTANGVTMEQELGTLKTNLNAMFLVIMGSIIIFMQAGFGFLEAGSIRAKNTTNILIKNFADLTFGKIDDL